jgi:hypothetical protein
MASERFPEPGTFGSAAPETRARENTGMLGVDAKRPEHYACESAFSKSTSGPHMLNMNHAPTPSRLPARRNPPLAGAVRNRWLPLAFALAASLPTASLAIDFGPFSLTGFAKLEGTYVSDYCPDCQRDPNARKDYVWADELVQGKTWGSGTTHLTMFQPYLGAKFDLGRGFKLSALLSQRWRNGSPDFSGFLYEKSLTLSHEDYGSLQIGAMPTRAWSFSDYPFGTNIGMADEWGASGAGYGLLTHAIRLTSRPFDVAEGDLVLEATYDFGKSGGWEKNKPSFLELWAHYGHGDLSFDFMYQDTRNGAPSAFGHGPFSALFYDASFDQQLGGSSQGIALAMATYRVDPKLDLYGGLRGNRWSGAYAVLLQSKAANPGGYDIWSWPFNVDWNKDLGGGVYKGYPATSVDFVLGARYKIMDKLDAYTGVVHLGAAASANPMDRGQQNSATFNTLGLNYAYGHGFQFYGTAGMVNYAKLGLSPTSMPSNSAFTNIDSRLTTRGYWFTIGSVFTF